ncbi:phenylacetate--CoA ligase family protein [Candidatus Bathyarchaeota archaeon]|nr:phenylacetate--CoA ligase family protein [Candidatus Bathyarchaeota archaeon]MBS7630253.1 phenylacetate--CoA ligase family protein [Candidatus Bathyarchaeota archaeon]
MRKNITEVISRKYRVQDLIKLETSGSTGKPFPVYITMKEDDYRKAKHLRANIYCGQKLRDRLVALTSPSHMTKVPKIMRTLGIYYWDFVSVFDSIEDQIAKIESLRPDILDGYSTSLTILAKELEKRGIKTINPRFLISGAELLDNHMREIIERVFEASVYDQYSIVEVERISSQCPIKKGYHIDADSLIIQFVDNNGEEVSIGEGGEIVCTSLFSYAMPFIRYAIGDIGVPTDETCECGITLPLMKIIEGRKDSLIPLPDGRILSPRMFSITVNSFSEIEKVDQFQVIQKKLDLFEFRIKKKNENDDEKILESKLRAHLLKMLNLLSDMVEIKIIFVDDIPLEKTGKMRSIISQIN